jgi:hypothetical protein
MKERTQEEARIEACNLINKAQRVLMCAEPLTTRIHSLIPTPRIHSLINELNVCWKHVRDMDVGDTNRGPSNE